MKKLVFDLQHSQRISDRRKEFLGRLVKDLQANLNLATALDAGCGVGFFSNYLASLGFSVTGFDVREEGIVEAKSRYANVEFCVWDVEDPPIQGLGEFDLVLCFGLLYHLENPLRAIRNLYSLTKKVLIVESLITPQRLPVAVLMDEHQGEDQGLNYVAFVPSESCLIKLLYRAGFPEVYRLLVLPDHEDFREAFFYKRRRTILVASKVKLQSFLLEWIPEPPWERPDLWLRARMNVLKRSSYPAKKFLSKARGVWHRLPLPALPVRLLWGGWYLPWNDVMGRHMRSRDNFEEGEQRFLLKFLKDGMCFFDIGAHQGLYTLLASKRVSASGRVFAFEPSPRELRRLKMNLFLNRCRNVHVVPYALGSNQGKARLFVCLGQETGCNSLRPPIVSEPIREVEVPITTLDRFFEDNGINKVDFIKLDVEGAELEVLKGAIRVLSYFRPLILSELADMRTEPWGYRSAEIYDFLVTKRYQWFSITPEGRLQHCSKKEDFHENLLAVPGERVSPVEGSIAAGEQCVG